MLFWASLKSKVAGYLSREYSLPAWEIPAEWQAPEIYARLNRLRIPASRRSDAMLPDLLLYQLGALHEIDPQARVRVESLQGSSSMNQFVYVPNIVPLAVINILKARPRHDGEREESTAI